MLIDVHAHLDMLDNLDEVIENAKDANVKVIITNGTDVKTNRKVLGISEKYDIVKPALGIYPNDSLEMSDEEFEAELNFIEEQKPFAIGEIGLDYKEEVDKELMKKRFEKQVLLAKKLDIPVLIHSRKAELDVIEILEKINYSKIIMHCFGGRKHLVKRIIENKWFFSIPCIITRLQHFEQIVEICPLNYLLTETDTPFLSPYPNASNEPAFITETISKIAEIKGQTKEEVTNQIFMNYQRLF